MKAVQLTEGADAAAPHRGRSAPSARLLNPDRLRPHADLRPSFREAAGSSTWARPAPDLSKAGPPRGRPIWARPASTGRLRHPLSRKHNTRCFSKK